MFHVSKKENNVDQYQNISFLNPQTLVLKILHWQGSGRSDAVSHVLLKAQFFIQCHMRMMFTNAVFNKSCEIML